MRISGKQRIRLRTLAFCSAFITNHLFAASPFTTAYHSRRGDVTFDAQRGPDPFAAAPLGRMLSVVDGNPSALPDLVVATTGPGIAAWSAPNTTIPGQTSFANAQAITVLSTADGAVLDVNGDGLDDLVLLDASSGIWVLTGRLEPTTIPNGRVVFDIPPSPATTFPFPVGPYWCVVEVMQARIPVPVRVGVSGPASHGNGRV